MPRRPDDHVPGRSADWRPHDTDSSIDPFDGPPRSSRPPSSRPPAPPPPSRPGPPRSRGLAPRALLLAGGGVLAVVATVLVFLTDDPDLLRVAVVAAAWAFVLATFVAGRRGGEEADSAAREAALRSNYELELEREVAARRAFELELENDLRREAEGTMRAELDALRRELTAVAELRTEVARVAELRDDVAALAALREEVARVGALRDDVLALTALRSELGQVGELRTELDRLRAELTEQLSSEMLVERIVMRTQASRVTGGDGIRAESPAGWREEPPRELTGGWPAVRLEEHTGTQQYERVRVDRSPPPHAWQTGTGVAPAAPPPPPDSPPVVRAYAPPPVPGAPRPPTPPTEGYALGSPEPHRSRHAASGDDVEPPPSPRDWLASRSLLEDPVEPFSDERSSPYQRRRRTDDDIPPLPLGGPDDLLTTERPAAPRPTSAGYPFGPPAAPPSAPPPPASPASGPAPGSRRRRRYRDEDDAGDDVLARVLRGE